jgi:hypothetical protein
MRSPWPTGGGAVDPKRKRSLNYYKYERRLSNVFRYRRTIFGEKRNDGFNTQFLQKICWLLGWCSKKMYFDIRNAMTGQFFKNEIPVV